MSCGESFAAMWSVARLVLFMYSAVHEIAIEKWDFVTTKLLCYGMGLGLHDIQ